MNTYLPWGQAKDYVLGLFHCNFLLMDLGLILLVTLAHLEPCMRVHLIATFYIIAFCIAALSLITWIIMTLSKSTGRMLKLVLATRSLMTGLTHLWKGSSPLLLLLVL
jgi:hypothetical protein